MRPENAKVSIRVIAAVTCLAFFASCATAPQTARGPEYAPTASIMREARSANVPVEKRAADYLQAAAMTAPLLGSGIGTPACETYNAACGELTVLLRSSEGGRLWNQPLTLAGNNTTYRLRLEPASNAVWAPNYFTSFVPADAIKEKLIRKENTNEGVGGALVGVRKVDPPEKFAPMRGITAPVTATLNFNAKNATLALRRPAKQLTATVDGKVRPLNANFSAPLSYYPPPASLMFVGFLGGLKNSNYPAPTGLYFLQPYDPDRIPLVFVHGLFSTPFDWVKTINGLQADPEIRKHYQFWVFAYPTGNPILYSALRLRQELAKADQLYPNHKPYVVVGHSMGGMLTHDQVVTVTEAMWDKSLGQVANRVFKENSKDSLIVRATTFRANPRIKRVVFICTPHRGSDLASNGIGKIGISLITLPARLTAVMMDSLTGTELAQITGSSKRLPNSITGLKPSSPALPVINSVPIKVPYHSIIGDRGKDHCPNCSDGVVAYWSSHLDGAQSETIVPGPHGSCQLPQTIAELDRILRLHLGIRSSSKPTTTVAQASR
ncbi:MAG TPA: alpha/beta fold hydrolase [Candidatus Udaeobacter sp.]|nr:alpha/beta fold hydrolase [Candidatus Udaeobacter sp.]